MGKLTRAQIVARAGELASRTDLASSGLPNYWLNAWLREAYRSWTWPFLHKRLTGIALGSGATSIDLGNGNSGEALEIQHIFDPIRVYTSDKKTIGFARCRQLNDATLYTDEDLVDWSSSGKGIPYAMRLRPSNTVWGTWTLKPFPAPDKAYLLAVDYLVQPADMDVTSAGDALVPVYPSDETLVQALKCKVLEYQHDYDKLQFDLQILDSLKQGDKVRYGVVQGINDKTPLDSSVFRSGDSAGGQFWPGLPWGW
jgi:hypothetical protein